MRITESRLRRLVRRLISEAYEDVENHTVRVRVMVSRPTDPTVLDILTDIRSIENVVTVTQEGAMAPGPEGKDILTLTVAFENDEEHTLGELEKAILGIEGVDMVRVSDKVDE